MLNWSLRALEDVVVREKLTVRANRAMSLWTSLRMC
jgi:hypothetical protein